jgi:RNA polymerase sigma-70 factor, ECF subfamily
VEPTTSNTSLPDEALAGRARRGDASAFAVLVSRYQESLYRIAHGLCPDDVEEIIQRVFLEAHRDLQRFDLETRFGVWLRRIAVDAIRRRSAATEAAGSPDASRRDLDRGDTPVCSRRGEWPELTDALVERLELADRICFFVQSSEEIDRAAFVLREIESIPDEQVAAILGISPETVSRAAHRMLLALREYLDLLMDQLPAGDNV